MDRAGFMAWLAKQNNFQSKKLITDCVSRASRVESEFKKFFGDSYSFDKEFKRDSGEAVKRILSKRGNNSEMNKLEGIALPIGTAQMNPITAAVKKYFDYLESQENNK